MKSTRFERERAAALRVPDERPVEQLERAKRLLCEDPQDLQLGHLAACALSNLGLPARGLALLDDGPLLIVDEAGTDDSARAARASRAHLLWEAGRMDEAEQGFRDAIEMGYGDVQRWSMNLLGGLLAIRGRYAEAREVFERSVREDGERADEALLNLAKLDIGDWRFASARSLLLKSLELDPGWPVAEAMLANVELAIAAQSEGPVASGEAEGHLERCTWAEALVRTEPFLENREGWVLPSFLRARAWLDLRFPTRALEELNLLWQTFEDEDEVFARIWAAMGEAHIAGGWYEAGERVLRRAVRAPARGKQTSLDLGAVLVLNGKLDEAREVYVDLLGTEAGGDALCSLARLDAAEGHLDRARVRLEQSLTNLGEGTRDESCWLRASALLADVKAAESL